MSHGGEAASGSGSLFYYDTDGTAQEVTIGSQLDVLRVSVDLIPKFETPLYADGPSSASVQSIPVFDNTDGKSLIGTQVLIGGSGHVDNMKTITYQQEFNKGDGGANIQINWNQGQKQTVRLNAATPTITFVNPSGAGNFLLRVRQDGTGGRVPTWPSTVNWAGAAAPDFASSTGNQQDIVSFYYSGNEYYGVASLDFA